MKENEKINLKRLIQNGGLQVSSDMDEETAIKIVNQFMTIAKSNGLTTRQAQTIFQICSEYVLDYAFIENPCECINRQNLISIVNECIEQAFIGGLKKYVESN